MCAEVSFGGDTQRKEKRTRKLATQTAFALSWPMHTIAFVVKLLVKEMDIDWSSNKCTLGMNATDALALRS